MDLFDGMFRRKIGRRHQEYRHASHEDYDRHHDSRHFAVDGMHSALGRIFHNKALLLVVAGILVLIIIVLVILAVAILPLVSKSIAYLNENGFKVIVDALLAFVDKLWKGAGGT